MAIRDVYVAGSNGIGYTKEVTSSADYASIANDTYFKDLSLGVGGLILYKDPSGDILSIFSTEGSGGTVTSVDLSMPSAFSVSNSPITSSGTIAVTGAGIASQYVRGDGTLANFPTSTGGGASVSYYLNGSVSQGTIGGVAYTELNATPVIGAGTDFSITADGYIAQFITDAGDPNKLLIPGGNWNFETYFSASSGGGTPKFYIELYKYDGAVFTLISSTSASPENITGGTSIDLYFTALAVPPTVLSITDRLAVRFYVIHSGRTITMHTENSHLSQIITTFSTGLNALNGLTSQAQYFAIGTSGTDFNISSATDTHTFNIPTASALNRGVLSSTDWSTFSGKQDALGFIAENVANKSTSTALGTSDTLYPTQNAVKVYTDNLLGNANALVYKGTIDCSTNPDYPAADAGWMYIASVAGKIGGASGTDVEVGDMIICNTDGTVSGNQATVGQYWNVIQKNIAGAVTGPASSVNNTVAVFDGTTGKVIKQGIITDTGTNIGIGTTTPTAKLHVNGSSYYSDNLELAGNKKIWSTNASTYYIQPCNNGTNTIDIAGFSGVKFFTGSSIQRMRIDSSGNVGIGTDTPTAKLHISNTGSGVSFLVEDSTNPDATPFVIDANGNVGMGTLTPQNVLHVKSNPTSTGTAIIRVESDSSSANSSISYYSGGVHRWEVGTGISSGASYEIYDRVAGQTRFSITTSGSAVFSNGDVTISTIANATINTDKFLVSDGGVIKYRTAAELSSDIGASFDSGKAYAMSTQNFIL